jgi:uncharacterized membrane protein
VLRTSIVSLVVVSLAAPTIPLRQDGTSVVFAVDESASMSEEVKRDARQWVQDAMKGMSGQDRAAVVTFGRDPQVQRGLTEERDHAFTTSQFDDSSTSIERALRVSRSLLSNAGSRRIVLVTDGAENAGDARQESRLAAAEGIEVSSVVIPSKTVQPEVLVQAIEAPSNVRDGEDFDLTVTVYSTVKQPATIRLWLDNKGVGSREIDLEPGATRFTIPQPPLPAGYHAFRLTVESLQDTQPNNNVAFTTSIVRERPRVLLIEGKDGDGKPIAAALASSGIDVDTRQPKAIPNTLSGLRDYQSIVLFDVPATGMTLDQMKTLEQYVQTLGRGLLAIGGSQSYGLGDYADTALEATLPVSMDIPPRDDKPSVALLLIIDKSGSMDYGGRDGPAGGGTEIFPALQTGYVDLRKRTAQLRHIILLTDGKSFTGGDYDSLVDRMRQDQITLSTVGIGNDTDEALLKSLAAKGKGRYNLTVDAKKIPQIVTKETKIASKNPIVESRFHVQLGEISPILRGFKPEDLPALKGYVVTTPKPTAQRVLSSPSGDPILSQWQYGLGRAVAWTPDIRERWASDWLTWGGFPKFISQAVRWTMPDPANRNLQTSVAFDGEETIISLDAADDDGSFIDLATTTMIVAAADGSAQQRQVTLRQIAPGRYEGRLPTGQPGAYRLQITQQRLGNRPPLQDIAGFSVPYPAELRPSPSSPALLHELARQTGGKLLAGPQDAFQATSTSKATMPYALWPWLLLIAGLLLPIEIAARRGILGSLFSRRSWRRLHFGRSRD